MRGGGMLGVLEQALPAADAVENAVARLPELLR